MPRYTVYAKIIRKGKKRTHRIRNAPIYTYNGEIVSYTDLKSVLLDVARQIYWEFEQTVSEVSVEKHLGGKYITKTTSYRTTKMHYRRQYEFRARLTYSKNQDTVKIEQASFITPEFYEFKTDHDLETGKKWQIPKVVPSSFEALLHSTNPDALFVDMLTIKNTSYMAQPKNVYASTQEKHHTSGIYAGVCHSTYAGREQALAQQDKLQKQNRH
jgi:hypothetical protein